MQKALPTHPTVGCEQCLQPMSFSSPFWSGNSVFTRASLVGPREGIRMVEEIREHPCPGGAERISAQIQDSKTRIPVQGRRKEILETWSPNEISEGVGRRDDDDRKKNDHSPEMDGWMDGWFGRPGDIQSFDSATFPFLPQPPDLVHPEILQIILAEMQTSKLLRTEGQNRIHDVHDSSASQLVLVQIDRFQVRTLENDLSIHPGVITDQESQTQKEKGNRKR